MPREDATVAIVLNGASSAGKSTVAAAIRQLWRRPLQVSGVDSFLALQAESFFGIEGATALGFTWSPVSVEGAPAFAITPGPLGHAMVGAAHRYWRACMDGRLDQVIDHVLLEAGWATDMDAVFAAAAATVIWVGVHCPIEVLEQRERDRGDRTVGQARGHAHLVHQWREYDIDIDTSVVAAHDAALTIVDLVAERTGVPRGVDGLWPEQ